MYSPLYLHDEGFLTQVLPQFFRFVACVNPAAAIYSHLLLLVLNVRLLANRVIATFGHGRIRLFLFSLANKLQFAKTRRRSLITLYAIICNI